MLNIKHGGYSIYIWMFFLKGYIIVKNQDYVTNVLISFKINKNIYDINTPVNIIVQ